MAPSNPQPALLMTMSSRPHTRAAEATTEDTWAASVTSSAMISQLAG